MVSTVLKTLINLKNKIQSQPEPTGRNDLKTDFEKRCSRKSVIDCNNVVGFFTVEIHGNLCILVESCVLCDPEVVKDSYHIFVS